MAILFREADHLGNFGRAPYEKHLGEITLKFVPVVMWMSYDSLHQITVDSYDFLFNCTTVGQVSDSMTVLT